MKKYIVIISCSTFLSCQESVIKKPSNLIKEDQMISIFYDLALVEAIKTNQPNSLEKNGINSVTYIYQKYNIDSTQFAQSNKYYAGDIEKYAQMYTEVSERLQDNRAQLDSIGMKIKKDKNNGELGGEPPTMN